MTTLTRRLDAVFELRAMSTRALQRLAVARGLNGWGERGYLMRAIYWDIVELGGVAKSSHDLSWRV